MTPSPRTETVSIDGISLFTRTVGDGIPTVILHGGPGAHHDYLLPQFDDLAQGRRLHYYDQRGGGQSPVDYDVEVGWERQVADLIGLLDHWEMQTANIVGYSWGGLLALLAAVHSPERLEHLALVSPAPTTADGRREFERRFAERSQSAEVIALRTQLQESGLREQDPDTYRQRAFEVSVAGYFADVANVRNLTPFRVTGRTQKAVWSGFGDYDIRDQLTAVDVPATVLHGAHDPIPLATAQDTADRLNAPLVVMPNSGHCPYIEDRVLFVKTLDAFLPR